MLELVNPQAYARKLLSIIEKRQDQESFPVPCVNLKVLCKAAIEGSHGPLPEAKPKRKLPDKPVPVKNPQKEVVRLLKAAEGSMALADLSLALGQKNIGTTHTMIKAMVKKKQVSLDKDTRQVSLL